LKMTKIHSRIEHYVYAIGDSFTNGDELAEGEKRGVCIDNEYRLKNVYSARMAHYLGIPFENVTNDGIGAGSNCRCVRRTMKVTSEWIDEGKDPSKLLIVIGWSMCRRTELYLVQDQEEFETEDHYNRYYAHFNDTGNMLSGFMAAHRENFVGTGESNTRYGTQLVTMQSYLKEYGFPFLFFNSCWRAKPKLSQNAAAFKLVDKNRFIGFHDRLGTMCNYLTFVKKLEMNPRGHPTEKGHDLWGKLLADKFLELDL